MRAEAKAAIVCLVGALLWFSPWLAPGKALLGTHPGLFRPYEEAIPPERLAEIRAAAHPLYSDKVLQHDPEVRFTLDATARGGALPAWNPQVLGGLPHLATGLSSALYPLMWISRLVPPPRCYATIAALQAALCAWFAFLMLRAFRVRPAAAACGALLFAASGWMSVHQEYFQLTAAAAWLPLSLAGAKWMLDRRGGGLALGSAVACAFLSGFPQIAVYSLVAPALLWAGTAIERARRREEGALAAAKHGLSLLVPAALGLAIAAPQLLPTAELVEHSTRQPLSADLLEQQALPPPALVGALLPDLLAQSRTQAELAAEEEAALAQRRAPRQETLFGLALSRGRAQRNNRFEITFALGPAALWFALAGLLGGRRGPRLFFAALLLAGLALTLPGPLLRASALVPAFTIGDPKRALLLVELSLAALAALGVEQALDDEKARRRTLRLLAGAAALLLLAAGAGVLLDPEALRDWAAPRIARNWGSEDAASVARALAPDWLDASRALLVRELLLAAAFSALAFVALLWRHLHAGDAASLGGLPVALAAPLALLWSDTTSPIPIRDLDALPSLVMHFRQHRPNGRILRVGPRGEMPPWPPKLPMLSRARDAQGYVGTYLQRWRDLLEAVDPRSTTEVGIWPLSDARLLERPLFDLLDVEYAFAALAPELEPPEIEGWKLQPIDPPPPPDAPYRLVLWRNENALGRARVVRKVQIAAGAQDVVRRLSGTDCLPSEEAWTTFEDAEPLLRSPDWTRIDPERGAQSTLAFVPVPPDSDAAPARVELLAEASDDLRLRVSGGGGLLVQSDAWYPGWTARVDGRPEGLLRVDHALRGVVVPPGEHEVHFHYVPRALIRGLFLVPAALAGLALASVLLARRRAAP